MFLATRQPALIRIAFAIGRRSGAFRQFASYRLDKRKMNGAAMDGNSPA
jgi:hypothetical protein